MSKPHQVGILMGSDSDLGQMEAATKILDELSVTYQVNVLSAHRTPEPLETYLKEALEGGAKVFICGAGASAHLAGAVASMVTVPVIAVPLDGSPIGGIDALYSMVQMPGGIPVATMGIGKSGAKNAGILAGQIIGLSDPAVAEAVIQQRADAAAKVLEKNDKVRKQFGA